MLLDSKIVGYVVWRDGFYVSQLYVDPPFHRKGIGRRLMNEVLKRASSFPLKLRASPNALGFYESFEKRRHCCNVRKVQPLQKALKDKDLWLTGLRREQNVSREQVPFLIWDKNFQLVKANPIADWDAKEVEQYIKKNNIPVCSLHGKDFPSIGCAPCTRAVRPGADPRSGRWWWESPDGKECGLHK